MQAQACVNLAHGKVGGRWKGAGEDAKVFRQDNISSVGCHDGHVRVSVRRCHREDRNVLNAQGVEGRDGA